MLLGLCCLGLCLLGLCLLHHGGLQVHLACAGDLRLNVVAVDGGFEQADAAHLGACLDVCAALDLQALDDGDGIAVNQLIAHGVQDFGAGFFLNLALRGAFPLVAAHGACPEFTHFVGVVFVAFGAGGCFDFVEVFAHGSFFDLCGCATPLHLVPRRWAVVLRRVGARQRGRGATVEGARILAFVPTIPFGGCEPHVWGGFLPVFWVGFGAWVKPKIKFA